MTQQTIADAQRKEIADKYEAELKKNGSVNKTQFAATFSISPRSLNRILEKFGLKDTPADKPAEPKTKEGNEKTKTRLEKARKKVTAKKKKGAAAKEPTSSSEKAPKSSVEKTEPDDPVMSFSLDASRFITLMFESGDTVTLEPGYPHYAVIHKKLMDFELAGIKTLACMKTQREALESGNFVVDGTTLTMNGVPVTGKIATEICDLFKREEPVQHLLNFYRNLSMSFSPHIFEYLFTMVKNSHIEINEAGNVIAYRRVTKDFKDCRTGRIDNSVGETPTVPYHEVDPDFTVTCGRGLHVCAPHYLNDSNYGARTGSKVIKVEVEPRDFVAIPPDYQFTKARVCSYKVIEDITADFNDGKYRT